MRNIFKAFSLILFLLSFLPAVAQNSPRTEMIKINGIVNDKLKEPLIGVAVQDLRTRRGTTTNINGYFEMMVPKGSTLRFSYLGMVPTEVAVNRSGSLDIMLNEEVKALDEAVVTGYVKTTKRRTTGSVSTLKLEDLDVAPTANLDMMLQGKIAGVDIKATSGRPGAGAKIRIRGTNTISGNAEPLWVVDGVVLQKDIPTVSTSQIKAGDFNDILTNGISGINPNDIENITVLKDASAAAIYGSRAASGVVVVTTKQGKAGKTQISYSTTLSMVFKPSRSANLMNSTEKLAFEQELWDEFSRDGFNSNGYYPVIGAVGMIYAGKGIYAGLSSDQQQNAIDLLSSHTTDWYNELFRNSLSTSHYLSVSGGNEKNTYYVSGGYSSNNGLVKHTDYSRYNCNVKVNSVINSHVEWGIISDLAYQITNGSSMNVDPFAYAYFANPYEHPYNADGSYAADNTYFMLRRINGGYEPRLPAGGFNIFREMDESSSEGKNASASVSSNIRVKITDKIRFEGQGAFSYVANHTDNINGKNTYAAFMDRPFDDTFVSTRTYGSITQTSAYNTNYSIRGQFYYSDTFHEKHYVSALAGSEIRGSYAKNIFEKRYGYDPVSGNSSMPVPPSTGDRIDYNQMISYAAIMDALSGQSITEDAYASFYASLDYVYNSKYILSVTARTDGSNNFGSKEQFNPTGSVGLSWNVDQERFMASLKSVVSSLSIRAATGYTGNINKSVYPQFIMDYETSFRKTLEDYYRMGSIRNAPNPHLRWEKTHDMKLSLDAGFFNERYRLQGEIYNRRSRDVVTSVRVPSTTGFTTQSYNTSEILNQGAELTLSGLLFKNKNFTINASANIAYNLNKLTKYVSPTGSIYGSYYVGYPLGSIFAGKCTGIDPATGIYMFQPRPDAVLNSTTDKKNAENYLFYVGTSSAPANGGYSVSVSWRQLNLSMGGSYSIGGKIRNEIVSPASYGALDGIIEPIPTSRNDLYAAHLNLNRNAMNRWTVDNPITNGYPRLIDALGERLFLDDNMTTLSTVTSGALLEKVSYFKIGSVALSYSFKGSWMPRVGITSLGLMLSINNILTLTNYSGIDPEIPGATYPAARTISAGLNIGF